MNNATVTNKERKYRYTLDLQTFAEPEPIPEPTPEPIPEPEPKKLEMSQEEFDAKIAERLARQAKKYSDYDELKTKLSEFEKTEAERKLAAMSETERLQAEIDAAKKAVEEAENGRKQAIDATNQRLIKAEFRALASTANLRKDAIDDAYTLAEKSGMTIGDDGEVVGVAEALEALIAAKPYLVENTPTKPKIIGEPNNPKEDGAKTGEQILAEAAEKARKTGRMEDRVAYATLKNELSK